MLNKRFVSAHGMGTTASAAATFDLGLLDPAFRLRPTIGSIADQYNSGFLTQDLLLELTLKERVECALVLAAELMAAFAEDGCAPATAAARSYALFVQSHSEAGSPQLAEAAENILTRCDQRSAATSRGSPKSSRTSGLGPARAAGE